MRRKRRPTSLIPGLLSYLDRPRHRRRAAILILFLAALAIVVIRAGTYLWIPSNLWDDFQCLLAQPPEIRLSSAVHTSILCNVNYSPLVATTTAMESSGRN